MVRVNLINPKKLSDQHLIAEYNEILMLVAYIKNCSNDEIPKNYCLGRGHMKFFKDKLWYLKERHEKIKKEMKRRGFKTRKTIKLKDLRKFKTTNWKPKTKDLKIIKKRLNEKIKKKPGFYRYYKEYKPVKFFLELIRN